MMIVYVAACCDPILNNAHPELTETNPIHVAVAVAVAVAGGDDDGDDDGDNDGTVVDDGCEEGRITVGCRED